METNAEGARLLKCGLRQLAGPEGELDGLRGTQGDPHVLKQVADALQVSVLPVNSLDRWVRFVEAVDDKIVLLAVSLPELSAHALGGLTDDVGPVRLPGLGDLSDLVSHLVDLLGGVLDPLGVLGDGELHLSHLLLMHQHPLVHVGEGRCTALTCPKVTAGCVIDGPELLDKVLGEGGAARVDPTVTLGTPDAPVPLSLLHFSTANKAQTFGFRHSEKQNEGLTADMRTGNKVLRRKKRSAATNNYRASFDSCPKLH